MIYGIVVAGGKGTRIGFRKQYARLAGKPVWHRSVDALMAGGVSRLWMAVPEEDVEWLRAEMPKELVDIVAVVAGGSSRFESVRNALAVLLKEDVLPDYVAVHDAARPFVQPHDVASVLQAAVKHGGAILATPSPDTVKSVRDGCIMGTVPRETVWLAQTPQVFHLHWMKDRYFAVEPSEALTDDAALFEPTGHTVHIVPATGYNRKITTLDDWEYASWLAAKRWGDEKS